MQVKVYGVIYSIRNKINGKIYIGQTVDAFNIRYSGGRWWKHTTNRHLKFSAKKYGHGNFEVNKNLDVAFNKEELDKKEIYWINYFDSTNPKYGYNKKSGGANGKPNKEMLKNMTLANRKIALMKKGIKRSPEVGGNISSTKTDIFKQKYGYEYSLKIQNLIDSGVRKMDICNQEDISMHNLNKIIEIYKLNFIPTSSMKGVTGENHHNFGKAISQETKDKVKMKFQNNFEEKFGKEVNNISNLLENKTSISEIARIYECGRPTIRKVIDFYGLKKYGLNVKKTKL